MAKIADILKDVRVLTDSLRGDDVILVYRDGVMYRINYKKLKQEIIKDLEDRVSALE